MNQHILFKIHNDTILNEQVPTGKAWHVAVEVRITETDT